MTFKKVVQFSVDNLLYDLNRDQTIDVRDLQILSPYYQTQKDNLNYLKRYDFNDDGIIDLFDYFLIAKQIKQ